MKKFFLVIGILFAVALILKICLGDITWQNVKDKSLTVKESFLKTTNAISETSVKVKDFLAEKIQEIKDKRKK